MAVSANSRLFILLLVAVANRSATEEFKSAENVETFLNSIIQLRDKSDTFKQYATQVQSLFCPEQPICGDVDEKNRTDDLRNLSISMGFGLDDSRVEDVFNAIRACCLPCSCDVKTCTENGNCCPSQIFSDVVSNNLDDDVPNVHGDVSDTNETFSRLRCDETKPLHSECIKAVRDSYMDKNVIHLEHDLTIPSYFMIAQCFGNCASDLTVKKCHHPSGNEFEEMVPVTSSDTRRIYWNTHCARCNNDGSNLVPWNSTVRFNFDIAYFFNHSSDTNAHYPENHDDILDYISKSGYILFTPPFPIADKLCIQKNILKTCMRPSTTTTNAKETSWLHEACDHIYSPFIVRNIFGRAYPFLNVFCYLCQHQNVKLDVKQSKQRQCEFTLGHLKSSSRQVTGLLNYRALTGDTVTDINEGRVDSFGSTDGKCGCAKTLDTTAVSKQF